jgi:hypothetical protein
MKLLGFVISIFTQCLGAIRPKKFLGKNSFSVFKLVFLSHFWQSGCIPEHQKLAATTSISSGNWESIVCFTNVDYTVSFFHGESVQLLASQL